MLLLHRDRRSWGWYWAGTPSKGGLESFRDLAKRDPQFALQVEEARNAALGRVEETIAKRAIEGVERPIFQRGELVGTERVYSDHLLLRLAQRLDPLSWTDRQKVEHSGRVEHAGVMLSITAGDVLRPPEKDQEILVHLVQQIAELKDNGQEIQGLPPPGEAGQ